MIDFTFIWSACGGFTEIPQDQLGKLALFVFVTGIVMHNFIDI